MISATRLLTVDFSSGCNRENEVNNRQTDKSPMLAGSRIHTMSPRGLWICSRKGRVAESGDGETILSLPRPQDRTNHFRYEHGTEKWNKVGEKPRKSCRVGRRGVLSSSGLSSSFLRSVGGVVAALIRQFIKLRCRVGRAGGTWRWPMGKVCDETSWKRRPQGPSRCSAKTAPHELKA